MVRTAVHGKRGDLGESQVGVHARRELFVPRHPATRMSAAQAREAEQPLDIPAFIDSALAQTEVVEVRFPRTGTEKGDSRAESKTLSVA